MACTQFSGYLSDSGSSAHSASPAMWTAGARLLECTGTTIATAPLARLRRCASNAVPAFHADAQAPSGLLQSFISCMCCHPSLLLCWQMLMGQSSSGVLGLLFVAAFSRRQGRIASRA